MLFVRSFTGSFFFETLVTISLIAISSAFILFIIKTSTNRKRLLFIIVAVVMGFTALSFINIPEEKIHLIEFSILGWFAMKDFSKRYKFIQKFILSIIICSLFGIFDEIFQGILPYRYFDIRDIIFNITGGIWGIIIYFLQY